MCKRFIIFIAAALIMGGCVTTRPTAPQSYEMVQLDRQHIDQLAEEFKKQIAADHGAGKTRFKMVWPKKKKAALFGQLLEQKLRQQGFAVSNPDDNDPAGLLLSYSVDNLAPEQIVVRVTVAETMLSRAYGLNEDNRIIAATGFTRRTHVKGGSYANR